MDFEDFWEIVEKDQKEYDNTHETKIIAQKRFVDKENREAIAEILIVETSNGEIENGIIYCRTSSGCYYSTTTYQEAIDFAKALVDHWNNGDYQWEPAKAN